MSSQVADTKLEQKAKTTCDIAWPCGVCDSQGVQNCRGQTKDEKWVLLSDAQQDREELMKENGMLKDLLANHDDLVTRNVKLEKIHGELKQKLQRWFEELGRWIYSQRKDWSHPELPEDLKKQFEELLKK